MTWNAQARRRWLGAACLIIAIGMLVCDQTLLKGRLGGVGFVAYWLVCFLVTAMAIGFAFLDARAIHRQTREEQRALFECTLQEVQQAKARKTREAGRQQNQAG